MIYKDKIFTLFPARDKYNDTNPDSERKGTLERLNETVGLSIDEEVKDTLESLIDNVVSIPTIESKFLAYFENDRGSSLNYYGDSVEFRRAVQKHILSFYKIKGTFKLLKILLSMIGIEMTFSENFGIHGFDSSSTFDDVDRRFDGKCGRCPRYSLDLTGSEPTMTEEMFRALIAFLRFNMPLDVEIEECLYNGDVAVDYTVTITTLPDGSLSYSNPFDLSLKVVYEAGQPIITTELPYYEIISPTELNFVFLGELIS